MTRKLSILITAFFLSSISLSSIAKHHIDESKIDKPYYTKLLQKCLNDIGYDVGKADGIMGARTRAAANKMIDDYNNHFGKNYEHDLMVFYSVNYCKSLAKEKKKNKPKPTTEKVIIGEGSFIATFDEKGIGGKKDVQINWVAWHKKQYKFSKRLYLYAPNVLASSGKNMQLDDPSKACSPKVWPRCTGARTPSVIIGTPHKKLKIYCGDKVRTMSFPKVWTGTGRDIAHNFVNTLTCSKSPSKIEAL